MSWTGIAVRHKSGERGRIVKASSAFDWMLLTIAKESGGTATVQLNALSGDEGEKGWSWLCGDADGDHLWLPLGDHNPEHVAHSNAAHAD